MQEQSKNIFVTLEVAKMAKEKGFSEWCAAYYDIQDHNEICANVVPYDKSWCEYEMSEYIAIPVPTHFQLAQWLFLNHRIMISQESQTNWIIYRKITGFKKDEISRISEINEALRFALNLINTNK